MINLGLRSTVETGELDRFGRKQGLYRIFYPAGNTQILQMRRSLNTSYYQNSPSFPPIFPETVPWRSYFNKVTLIFQPISHRCRCPLPMQPGMVSVGDLGEMRGFRSVAAAQRESLHWRLL